MKKLSKEQLKRREDLMTGPEVARMRSRLGASPDEMASLLGVTLATVYKWEAKRGELPALGLAQKRLFMLIGECPSRPLLMTTLRTGTWRAAWAYLMAPLARTVLVKKVSK